MSRLLSAALVLLLGTSAHAVCEFNGGTIANPNDPECRDAQFVFTENSDSGNNIALGYPPPMPVESLTGIDGFRTYASLHARHQDLALSGDAVASVIIGQTLEGRDIWAYQHGDSDLVKPDNRAEAAMIVNGGIHAREWQSPEVLTETIEQLVEGAADGNLGQYLHDQVNIILIPVLNIDGFIQTQRFPDRATADSRQPRDGRMRRKNMRNPAGGTVDDDIFVTGDNFHGVDLNRNSEHGFAQNNGSSSNPISLVYRGATIASEPEIQALVNATTLGPAERLRLGIDVHSFTQVYFTPRTANTRRNEITERLAGRMRAVTGFKYRYSPDPVNGGGIGTVADFFAYQFQIPAWTLETEPLNGGQDYGGTGASHSGFVLPDDQIARTRNELAQTLILGFYRQAGPASVTAAQIAHADSGDIVYAAQWITSGDSRTLQVDSDKALVPGESYTLWLGFDKPMRWFDGTGFANYPGQNPIAQPIVISSPDDGESFSFDVTIDDSVWLAQPGGAPTGYQMYRGDALAATFTVPQAISTATTSPTAVSLQIQLSDISQLPIDADPATVADWANGHWTGVEDSGGIAGDIGGADCTLVAFVANTADAASPIKDTVCPARALALAPPPPPLPPPAPAPAPAGSGGGGSPSPHLLLLMGLLLKRREQ
ncbi:MAG: hypothetical protein HKN49_11685 [Gammaproteobacteria bacterium]|nr:hypothetical protein [Gammaproteobacteria bacterium]